MAVITESSEYTANVEIPANGDDIDASVDGSFRKGIQALANRTKFFYDLITSGIKKLHLVADIAALQAIGAADRANGDVALVLSTWTIYVFRSSSSSTQVVGWVYAPSSGAGRWHNLLDPYTDKSPVRWNIPGANHLPFGVLSDSQAAPSAVNLTSTTYVAVGNTVAIGPLLAGDMIIIDGGFVLDRDDAVTATGYARLEIDGSSVADSVFQYYVGDSATTDYLVLPVRLTTVYTVPSDAPGGITIGMKANLSTASSGTPRAKGPFHLRALLIRP